MPINVFIKHLIGEIFSGKTTSGKTTSGKTTSGLSTDAVWKNLIEQMVAEGSNLSSDKMKLLGRLILARISYGNRQPTTTGFSKIEDVTNMVRPLTQPLETSSADMSRTMLLLNFLTQINHDSVRTMGGASSLVRLLSRQPARLVRPVVRFVVLMKHSPQSEWRRFLSTMRSENPAQAYMALMRMIQKENRRQQFLLKKVKFMTLALKQMKTDCRVEHFI